MTNRELTAADRPRVVCLCGSMRFEEQMREVARIESIDGAIVVLPLVNMKQPHPLWSTPETAEITKTLLDSLHKRKIDLADEVIVVSDETGYVGDSTRSEIAYAEQHGKPVRYERIAAPAPELIDPISAALSLLDRFETPGDRGRTLALISDLRQILAGA